MPKHRSFSQLSTYTSCPKKYEFNYVDMPNINTNSSAKSLGSALHKAQQFNYSQKIKTKTDLPFVEIEQFMLEFLTMEFKNNEKNPNFLKVKYNKKETPEELMNMASGLLTLLYKRMQITQPLYVELPIVLKILGQEFIMYIDLIDDQHIIRDLKTSASKYSEEIINFNTQLIAYALGYRTLFGKKENGIGLDVLVKTKMPQFQSIRGAQVTDGQIDRFLNSLAQVNLGIEKKIFPPVDNQMTCSWCDFKDLCREDGLPDANELANKLKDISVVKQEDKK